jgi:hypothetical protein
MGPGNGVGLHRLLNPVFPEDPGVDRMRGGGRADCELPELLRLQAAGLPLGDAWTFGHASDYRTGVLGIRLSKVVRFFSRGQPRWDGMVRNSPNVSQGSAC